MRRFLIAAAIAVMPFAASAHEADEYTVRVCMGSPQDIKDCEASRAKFRALYKSAFRNDYQAQRNLAYMLWNGSAVVVKDRKASCAWRMVIVALGSPKVDESDRGNLQTFCGIVSPEERAEAVTIASAIGRRVLAGGKIDETAAGPGPNGLDATAAPLFASN